MEFAQKFFFVKLIYLISRVFLAWTFLNFLAHCVAELKKIASIGSNISPILIILPNIPIGVSVGPTRPHLCVLTHFRQDRGKGRPVMKKE